jgi:hypothetical protein
MGNRCSIRFLEIRFLNLTVPDCTEPTLMGFCQPAGIVNIKSLFKTKNKQHLLSGGHFHIPGNIKIPS